MIVIKVLRDTVLQPLKYKLGKGTLHPEALNDIISDYPIDTGANEFGTWEKWKSGKLVMYGKQKPDVQSDHRLEVTLPLSILPSYAGKTYTNAQIGTYLNSSKDLYIRSSYIEGIKPNKMGCYRNIGSNYGNEDVHYYVISRYK